MKHDANLVNDGPIESKIQDKAVIHYVMIDRSLLHCVGVCCP